jgi:hypothetical protein
MPDVFAPPPEIVAGFMAQEAERALTEWNPFIAEVIKRRGLFGAVPCVVFERTLNRRVSERVLGILRRNLFDHFGRR